MPSAQVVNFGADPYANAMGGFAKSLLGEIEKGSSKRRNDELFEKIKDNYGPNAKAEDILRDIVKATGFDQDYKTNLVKDITEYATLASKKDANGLEKAKLDQRRDELDVRKTTNKISQDRLDHDKDSVPDKRSKSINDYNGKFQKDAKIDLTANDKADWNYFTEDLMNNQKLSLNEASNKALQLINMRREKIDEAQIAQRPQAPLTIFGRLNVDNNEVDQAFNQAFNELMKLYKEDGIDNQKDLREIAERAGWSKEETTKLLQAVFKEDGRKLKGPQKANKPDGDPDHLFGVGG